MDVIKTVKELIDLAEKSNQKVSVEISFFNGKPYISFFHHNLRYEKGIEVYHIWNMEGAQEEDIEALENIKSVLKEGVAE